MASALGKYFYKAVVFRSIGVDYFLIRICLELDLPAEGRGLGIGNFLIALVLSHPVHINK
jgi:hypothetical protein